MEIQLKIDDDDFDNNPYIEMLLYFSNVNKNINVLNVKTKMQFKNLILKNKTYIMCIIYNICYFYNNNKKECIKIINTFENKILLNEIKVNTIILQSQEQSHLIELLKNNKIKEIFVYLILSIKYYHFLHAQKNNMNNFEKALKEIYHKKKSSCWIWYVFPATDQTTDQIKKTMSETTKKFLLIYDTEVNEYYMHPLLKNRLINIVKLLFTINDPIKSIMGSEIDVIKLKNSITSFYNCTHNILFYNLLHKYYSFVST
jgi:uncharacterized protein (DUF1810 family)